MLITDLSVIAQMGVVRVKPPSPRNKKKKDRNPEHKNHRIKSPLTKEKKIIQHSAKQNSLRQADKKGLRSCYNVTN